MTAGAPPSPARAPRAGLRLAVLCVYAVAMGWLEGVVVVYIRGLLGIAHGSAAPDPAEMERRLAAVPWLIGTEQGREAATLVMLVAVACLAAPRFRPRLGAFLLTFGTWDIAYYVALYSLLGWPPSPGTMDLLFLIPPGPWWYQPVWVPIVISCGMIAVGVWLFTGARRRRPG